MNVKLPQPINLDKQVAWTAIKQGASRNASSRWKGDKDKHGYTGPGWDIHIEGALAEAAVAALLELDAVGEGQYLVPDLSNGEYVKSTIAANGPSALWSFRDSDRTGRYWCVYRERDSSAFRYVVAGHLTWESGRGRDLFPGFYDPGENRKPAKPYFRIPASALEVDYVLPWD